MHPFAPGTTQTVAASTTSASATVPANASHVRVVNNSGQLAFVKIGSGAASNADTPMLTATSETFDKGSATNVSVILAASSGTVYVTAGEGGV